MIKIISSRFFHFIRNDDFTSRSASALKISVFVFKKDLFCLQRRLSICFLSLFLYLFLVIRTGDKKRLRRLTKVLLSGVNSKKLNFSV